MPPNFNLYQLGVGASYDSDLFGRISNRIEQQAALAEVQTRQVSATYLTLTGNTVSAAIQLAAAAAQRQTVQDIIGIDQQTLELVRRQNQVGAVADSDVVRTESQLAGDQTLQPDLEQQLSLARHTLGVLLGRAPGSWTAPPLTLNGLRLPQQIPLTLPSALVHQRPDILAAERNCMPPATSWDWPRRSCTRK